MDWIPFYGDGLPDRSEYSLQRGLAYGSNKFFVIDRKLADDSLYLYSADDPFGPWTYVTDVSSSVIQTSMTYYKGKLFFYRDSTSGIYSYDIAADSWHIDLNITFGQVQISQYYYPNLTRLQVCAGTLIANKGSSVWFSNDGESFTQVDTVATFGITPNYNVQGYINLTFGEWNGDLIVASNPSNEIRMHRSTDGGATFSMNSFLTTNSNLLCEDRMLEINTRLVLYVYPSQFFTFYNNDLTSRVVSNLPGPLSNKGGCSYYLGKSFNRYFFTDYNYRIPFGNGGLRPLIKYTINGTKYIDVELPDNPSNMGFSEGLVAYGTTTPGVVYYYLLFDIIASYTLNYNFTTSKKDGNIYSILPIAGDVDIGLASNSMFKFFGSNNKITYNTKYKVGHIRQFPFRVEQLPKYWYPTDGTSYPVNSTVGASLRSLSNNYKSTWGITESSGTINVPNLSRHIVSNLQSSNYAVEIQSSGSPIFGMTSAIYLGPYTDIPISYDPTAPIGDVTVAIGAPVKASITQVKPWNGIVGGTLVNYQDIYISAEEMEAGDYFFLTKAFMQADEFRVIHSQTTVVTGSGTIDAYISEPDFVVRYISGSQQSSTVIKVRIATGGYPGD